MPTAFTVEGATAIAEVATPQIFTGATVMRRQLLDIGFTAPTTEIVTIRTPQYGLPLAQRVAFLHDLLPNGGDTRRIGFFRTLPNRAGTGGVECSGSGYARVVHNSWRDVILGGYIARRANSGEILFAELTGDLITTGWGIWDDDDILRAFGPHRNDDGSTRAWELGAGDQPRYGDGSLQVGVQ